MTPLAPLRILLTGLIGLLVLGLGVYCVWRYADELQRPGYVAVNAVQPATNSPATDEELGDVAAADRSDTVVNDPEVRIERSSSGVPPWVFLTAGLLLIGLGLFGRWPLMWITRLLSSSNHAAMTPTRNQGKFIDRPDGTRLNVEVYGKLDGPTIIFTHGWSLDSTAWYYAKATLGNKFRVILWDLPGLGRSQAPDDRNFEIAKMADDLHAVVESLGATKPVYLVGHSIGGMITQIYAGKYHASLRQHVAGLILVHTTYTNPLRTMLGAPLWTAIEKVVIAPSQYLMMGLAPLAWLSNWHSYLNGSMQMTTRLTSFTGQQSFQHVDYAAWLSTQAWPAYIARGNLAMFRYDAQAALRELNVPLLVIGGKHDRITKPNASDRINEIAADSQLLVEAGGHLALFEFHDEVMRGIAEFVDAHEPVPHGEPDALTAS